jgi:hypothetical protein
MMIGQSTEKTNILQMDLFKDKKGSFMGSGVIAFNNRTFAVNCEKSLAGKLLLSNCLSSRPNILTHFISYPLFLLTL